MGGYKEHRNTRREKITNSICEISEAIKSARAKDDYKAVADMTNALTMLIETSKEAYGE